VFDEEKEEASSSSCDVFVPLFPTFTYEPKGGGGGSDGGAVEFPPYHAPPPSLVSLASSAKLSASVASSVAASVVARLSAPAQCVLVVKLAVGAPFAGVRAQELSRLVLDLANALHASDDNNADENNHGGNENGEGSAMSTSGGGGESGTGGGGSVQLVFLTDASAWKGSATLDATKHSLPPHLAPLVVPYTLDQIKAVLPEQPLPTGGPARIRARPMSKYYETLSWTWWWLEHGKQQQDTRIAAAGASAASSAASSGGDSG
jgi:hypothetical protein